MTPTSWYGVEQNFLVLVFGQKNKPLSQVAKLNTWLVVLSVVLADMISLQIDNVLFDFMCYSH